MRKLDQFFFLLEENEKLHPSDAWWFYGPLVGAAILTLIVRVVIL